MYQDEEEFAAHLQNHMHMTSLPDESQEVGATKATKPCVFKWEYLVEVVFALIPCGLYVGIYFLVSLTGSDIISYYYSGGYKILNIPFVLPVTSVPQPLFTTSAVIKSIALNWLMWKAANVLVILDMLAPLIWWKKLVGVLGFFITLCAADSVVFVMKQEYNFDFAFVGVACLLALIVTSCLFIKQKQRYLTTFANAVLPYFSYALIIAVYWIAMPQLYKVIGIHMESIYNELTFFYVFPIIDTLLILFNRGIQKGVSEDMKLFVSTVNNWLLQGYRVGIVLMCSLSEVEFYYLLMLILFRNLFFNYVIKESKTDTMNLSMPGWIFAFYISYIFNFLPVCGISNIVTSFRYTAYVSMNMPHLYDYNPYFKFSYTPSTLNILFDGNIVWFAPLLVWGVCSFTQKYHRNKFNWKLVIYNMFGIYLFYVGLISALGVASLGVYAPF